ncbi:hypothetical protein BCR44DRAFT_38662 [Catenaria anguillulae PL171]|uniref:BHLH domain-containing protein n=1 Tax=Catenaria anguillulae PL171 TaxID=765915 RepID=A0A1Y2HF93_9FUNG|nr:hypothetical protein BCR44DRAFT_38662 [Catenaria anguillulae PL171]
MNTIYDHVDRELPPVSNPNSTKRPPKLNILQRALEYIRDLKAAHSTLAQELTVLRMTVAQYQYQHHNASPLQLHYPQQQHAQVLSPAAAAFPPDALVGSPVGFAGQLPGPVQLVPPQSDQQQQQPRQSGQQQIQQQAPPAFAHTRSPSAASGSGFIHGNHHISVLQNPTPGTTPTIQHSQHPHSNLPTRTNSNNSVSSVGLGNTHMTTGPPSSSASSSLNVITSSVDHANTSASHQFSALFPSSSFDDVATVAGSQSSHANHSGFHVLGSPSSSSSVGPSPGTAGVPTIDTSLLFSSFGLSPPQGAAIAGAGADRQVNMTESNIDLASASTMVSQPNSASPMPPPTPPSTASTDQPEWSQQQQQPQSQQLLQMPRRVAQRPPHLNLHSLSAANAAMAGQPMSPFCASPFSPTAPAHAYSPVAAAGAAVGLMSLATAAQGGQQQLHALMQQQQQQQQVSAHTQDHRVASESNHGQ